MSMVLDILYKSVDPTMLCHTFSGHRWLAQGKRFIPSEYSVMCLDKWPPVECYPPQAADFLVLESAIEANISDPFIYMDSNLFVVNKYCAGWLNMDLACELPSETSSWLYSQGMRYYNYDHRLPVVVSHSQVRTLQMLYRPSVLTSHCIKTLLVNLDTDRRGRLPVYLNRLPIYKHVAHEQDILDNYPLFFTCDNPSPEILAYAQN